MLIKKTELSRFKTLSGDKFCDFVQNVQKCLFFFFKVNIGDISKNNEVVGLRFYITIPKIQNTEIKNKDI